MRRSPGSSPTPVRSLALLFVGTLAFAASLAPPAHAQSFTLGVRKAFNTGVPAWTIGSGDLNGDGRPDLVVTNLAASGVAVLLSSGAADYTVLPVATADGGPQGAAIGDVTGDGKADLVVTNLYSSSVSVFAGNGAGALAARVDYPTGASPRSVTIADLDGDNRPDMVITEAGLGRVGVYRGNGAGGFLPYTAYSVGSQPYRSAVGDINHDGRLDIVTANYASSSMSVLLADGLGGFLPNTEFPVSAARSVSLGDMNGDGHLDAVVAGFGSIVVLYGNGLGGFPTSTSLSVDPNTTEATVGDVTGDGQPDIVASNGSSSQTLSVYAGNGAGGWAARQDLAIGAGVFACTVADLNRDGRLDLVAAGGATVYTLTAQMPNLVGLAPTAITVPGAPVKLIKQDLNGDGRADLVALHSGATNSVSVWIALAGGGYGTRTDFAAGTGGATDLALTDYTGDGKLDAVVARGDGLDMLLLAGTGTGSFGATQDMGLPGTRVAGATYLGGPALFSIYNAALFAWPAAFGSGGPCLVQGGSPGDARELVTLDGAGGLGLVMAVGSQNVVGLSNSVSLIKSISNISYGIPYGSCQITYTSVSVGAGATGAVMRDLNADGLPDVAVASSFPAQVSVLLNNGAGGLAAPVNYSLPGNATRITCDDVNGDGVLDLATVGSASNHACVLLGEAGATFRLNTDVYAGTSPSSVVVADWNNDGRPDLLAGTTASSAISYLPLPSLGGNTLATSVSPISTTSWSLSASASLSPARVYPATYTGSVRFFDGVRLLGTAPLVVNGPPSALVGSASLQVPLTSGGLHSFWALYSGDSLNWGSASVMSTVKIVATGPTTIRSIQDVRPDQGGQVRLTFPASPYDVFGSPTPITQYEVYRWIKAVPAPAGANAPTTDRLRAGDLAAPMSVQLAGWDYVAAVPAHADSVYSVVVPTLADSNASGFHRAIFMVRAATASVAAYFDSPPDSGYSVDNIAPGVPTPFTAAVVAGSTYLHWGASGEPDFAYYRLYRGTASNFTPGPGNLLVAKADTGYVDTGATGYIYKLSAVDANGNESGWALLTPSGSVGVEDAPLAFALDPVAPNPAPAGALVVRFALADDAPARVRLFDVSGRVVSSHDASGAGRHAVDLAAGRPLAPGLYLIRLDQAGRSRTQRVVVTR